MRENLQQDKLYDDTFFNNCYININGVDNQLKVSYNGSPLQILSMVGLALKTFSTDADMPIDKCLEVIRNSLLFFNEDLMDDNSK